MLVLGGQGSAKVVHAACDLSQDQAWRKGYNDAQNDYQAGKPSNGFAHGGATPLEDYGAGYAQGYVDAGHGLYLLC